MAGVIYKETDMAAKGGQQAQDYLLKRGLTAPIGADYTDEIPLQYREVDIFQYNIAVVTGSDSLQFQELSARFTVIPVIVLSHQYLTSTRHLTDRYSR